MFSKLRQIILGVTDFGLPNQSSENCASQGA